MMWWVLFVFIGIILLLLPLKVRLVLDYGKAGFSGSLYLLVWKKVVWKKRYDEKKLFMLKRKKTSGSAAKKSDSRGKQRIIAAVKAEWQTIFPVAVKNLVIEKWTLSGMVSTDYPEMKGLSWGVFSGITWWFYGASQQWLVWKRPPCLGMEFSSADTNWQFQCMIKSSLGQLIGKGIKILMILVRRSVSNGAKERNRNAHANGYL